MKNGRIMKSLSGFYYVQTTDGIYQCRGRGLFRNQNITPLVGDFVLFEKTSSDQGYITEIKSRKNELVRPPIANIDQAIIVSSAAMPDFNPRLLDRFLVMIEAEELNPIIFITKMDAIDTEKKQMMEQYKSDYHHAGYPVELLSLSDQEVRNQLQPYFTGQVSVIAGQSGVGKSSLINALNASLYVKTGNISKSLGRGKHTTRHVELLDVGDGLVADTPGFSSLDFQDIDLGLLADSFPEFLERKHHCKFRSCMHVNEPKCAVKMAVADGEIPTFRYDHYLQFYNEIQTRKGRF